MSEAIFVQRLLRRSAPRNDIKKFLCSIAVVFCLFPLVSLFPSAVLAKAPSPRSITIQKVSLSDEAGHWKTIIEPDKLVDLDREEPGLSFFNNGRVEPGKYVNFELEFTRASEGSPRRIVSRQTLQVPLEVKKGSFIGVWFWLSESTLLVEKLELTVDEATRVFSVGELLEEKSRASF